MKRRDLRRDPIFWVVVALIVGAGAAYFYMQRQTSELFDQVSALQTQLAEADAQSAASQIEALQADLDEKTKLIGEQTAKLTELEAALQKTTSPAPE